MPTKQVVYHAYLNPTFFFIRLAIYFAVFIGLALFFTRNSLRQDETGDLRTTRKMEIASAPLIPLFALSLTFIGLDLFMSLDPHWFSTMFGVYCFAGAFYTVLALTAVITVWLKRRGMMSGILNENHLHDLGKFMFAFTVFYAYIGFSQFMLIWYANLPEETMYFMHRMDGGWKYASFFLLIGKFMIPFFMLLPRESKRSETILSRVGLWMLFAHWIDLMWIVQPEFHKTGPVIGWIEIGTAVGFVGLFGFMVIRFLSRNTVVAIGDPRLEESVHHHHQ
jgi:hypothetical protein